MGENRNQKSFWTTLPGIIMATATLITAIGGLVAILYTSSMSTPGQPTPTPTLVPPTVTPEPPTVMPPVPTTVTPPEPPTVTPPEPPTAAIVPEVCFRYNPGNLRITDEGDRGWLLTDVFSLMLTLDNEADARDALALSRRHTANCFIGRGNTRPFPRKYIVQYWE